MIKKSILKKLFIRISKILGYEIVDQNEFNSPTLDKNLNENLTNLNKSIVLPLGQVNITRKIKSILILFRTNADIDIWDQNKKRIFEFPKIEYVLRSLNSLVKTIKYLKKNRNNVEVNIKIVDSSAKKENLNKIQDILSKSNLNIDIISHNNQIYKDISKNTVKIAGNALSTSPSLAEMMPAITTILTAVIGAVGPEHCTRVPPNREVTTETRPAEIIPTVAPRPERMPKAAPRLRATKLTARPTTIFRQMVEGEGQDWFMDPNR